jgi:aryl-alcohol dehydrogenase-like predicted oxidoreductase
LTGRFTSPDDLAVDDSRRNHPRFQGENFTKNLELVARVRALAAAKGCSPAQLALAWVLAQGSNISPIPGSKRRTRLEENVASAEIQLTSDDLAALDAAAPKDVAAGTRYPAPAMAALNR